MEQDENSSEKTENVACTEEKILSKRAQKKQQKRQDWLDGRKERRAEEKARRKAKIAKRKAEDVDNALPSYIESRKRIKKAYESTEKSDIHVAFDLSFGSLMNQRDRGKCLKQLLNCYSINRRLKSPLNMCFTSFEGVMKNEMAERHQGYDNWDIKFYSEPFTEILASGKANDKCRTKDDVVYLSSESDNVLQDFDVKKIYVIGGLVDHNLHKGLCHKIAVEAGVSHARLPIDEFIHLKSRKVL